MLVPGDVHSLSAREGHCPSNYVCTLVCNPRHSRTNPTRIPHPHGECSARCRVGRTHGCPEPPQKASARALHRAPAQGPYMELACSDITTCHIWACLIQNSIQYIGRKGIIGTQTDGLNGYFNTCTKGYCIAAWGMDLQLPLLPTRCSAAGHRYSNSNIPSL